MLASLHPIWLPSHYETEIWVGFQLMNQTYLTSINSFMARHIPLPTSFAAWSLALRPCHNSLTMYITSSTSTYRNKRRTNFNHFQEMNQSLKHFSRICLKFTSSFKCHMSLSYRFSFFNSYSDKEQCILPLDQSEYLDFCRCSINCLLMFNEPLMKRSVMIQI